MIKFNKDGNLDQNLSLNFGEFKKEFGFNVQRNGLLEFLYVRLKIFKEYRVSEIYVVGSFITSKAFPRDLDVCWNMTNADLKSLEKNYPEFFSESGVEAVKLITGIHFIGFDNYSTEILDSFQFDRNKNKRGWVKISLFNLDNT